MELTARAVPAAEAHDQYSLAKILSIWALAAVPMAVLSWIVFPAMSPDLYTDPLGAGVTRIVLLTVGLVWLFVLSMIIVRKEEGDLRWTTIKRRLRLNAPLDPKSGERRLALWLWAIPLTIAFVVWGLAFMPKIAQVWVSLFPFLAEPPGYDFGAVLGSREILNRLVGAWWFLGLFVVSAIFNTVLGEEFLFRGVLLPKMEGVFGKWSWAANGVLFGFYHLHQPWSIPGVIVAGAFFLAFPSSLFRSTWVGVIVHSSQTLFFIFIILGIVLGFA